MTSRGFAVFPLPVRCRARPAPRRARCAMRDARTSVRSWRSFYGLMIPVTARRTTSHQDARTCQSESQTCQSTRDKKRAHLERERAALVGTDPRRLIWPAAFHIHGQGVCTVDPNGTNLERGASLEPPGRFTNEIGLRNVRSGSVWAARDRQHAVCVLFLAARPRFYEIIRDHPRSFTSSTWRRSRSPCRPRQ